MSTMPQRSGAKNWVNKTLYAAAFAAGMVLILWGLSPHDGMLGADYAAGLTRMLIGRYHFWQNGLSIPHYTPALCGGLPFFADPQSIHYSLFQMAAHFFPPLTAQGIILVLAYGLGYLGMHRLLTRLGHTSNPVAHIGALIFTLNGYTFGREFQGHYNIYWLQLFPWLILLLADVRQNNWFRHSLWLSLLVIMMFFGSGFHMMVVFFWTTLLLIPYIAARIHREKDGGLPRAYIFLVLTTIALVAAVCAGRMAEVLAYSPFFINHPEVHASSDSAVVQFVRFFWSTPWDAPLRLDFGAFTFGPWEYLGWISRMTLPLVLIYLAMTLRLQAIRKRPLFFLFTGLIFIFYVSVAVGGPVIHFLPFFRRYHNPIKFFGGLIPILILLSCMALDQIARFNALRWIRTSFGFFIIGSFLLAEAYVNVDFFVANKLGQTFPYSKYPMAELLERNRLAPVENIVDDQSDLLSLYTSSSSLKCYEATLGYRLENLKTTAIVGSSSLVRNGTFNMTHPGCLLFPDYFQCKPWDRIPASDRQNFISFKNGETTTWGVPPWLETLYFINGLAFTMIMGAFVWIYWRRRGTLVPSESKDT